MLLDTARTDEYNHVFITEYKNIVVDDVSLASYRVTDKYNTLSLTLDPDDTNVKFKIIKDGEEITPCRHSGMGYPFGSA